MTDQEASQLKYGDAVTTNGTSAHRRLIGVRRTNPFFAAGRVYHVKEVVQPHGVSSDGRHHNAFASPMIISVDTDLKAIEPAWVGPSPGPVIMLADEADIAFNQ